MIRVLIVDDSATVRRHLRNVYRSSEDFEVVGEVSTGDEALRVIAQIKPDLVSLDVFIQNQNAAAVVHRIMEVYPVPIVLVSDAPRNAYEVFEALAAGALECLHKPAVDDPEAKALFLKMVRTLSKIRVKNKAIVALGLPGDCIRLVAIGSSTGGPAALKSLLHALPKGFNIPIVIAQHLATGFDEALAQWLQHGCSLKMKIARSGELVRGGQVIIGRAGMDIVLMRNQCIDLLDAPARGYHPSADLLLSSAAEAFPAAVVGVILTGIGADGALGAEKVVSSGGVVMAQDKASSTVYGMPGSVARAGLATMSGSPAELARAIVHTVEKRRLLVTGRVGL